MYHAKRPGRVLLTFLATLTTLAMAPLSIASDGSEEFTRHCASCHGSEGDGDGEWYPSLSRLAAERDPEDIARTILLGRFGRGGEVQGHTIPIMPSWSRLSNEEVAAIVNFIQTRWGNATTAISVETVSRLRGQPIRSTDRAGVTPLSGPEAKQAQTLYLEHCVGCHGSERTGASGPALSHWVLRDFEQTAIRSALHYGSSEGMPAWGVATRLSADEMDLLSRYLAAPQPALPEFAEWDVVTSQDARIAVADRPERPERQRAIDHMFATMLHDIGAVLMIDGDMKEIFGQVRTDYAPHAADRSADGRYLYVVSRGGRLSQIDLWFDPPRVVNQVRAGYESRGLSVLSGAEERVVVSTLEPGNLQLFTRNLTLIKSLSLPNPDRLHQVVQVGDNTVLAVGKDSGCLYFADLTQGAVECLSTERYLRNGTLIQDSRYFIVPSDDEKLVVVDIQDRSVVDVIHIEGMQGAGTGALYKDPEYGRVWVVSALASDEVYFVGVDPDKRKDVAWKVVRKMKTGATGSLYVANHPDSRYLWIDTPLSPDAGTANSITLIDKKDPTAEPRQLNIANLVKLSPTSRTLHPQFNFSGTEVWLTVWNKQDETAAIAVLDESSQDLKQTIKDWRLITPTRSFNLGQLK